jgi:hypothetical protein
MWEVCCHQDHMTMICPTIQSHNLEKVKDIGFFSIFAQSPYALSLSFLKDPSLVGKGDEKYNLNLDE